MGKSTILANTFSHLLQQVDKLTAENERLRVELNESQSGRRLAEEIAAVAEVERDRLAAIVGDETPDDYAGWIVVSFGDDGSVLIESPKSGSRRRVKVVGRLELIKEDFV